MAKKQSLLGRGAEIFLGTSSVKPEPARDQTSTPQHQPAGRMYPKATFYLPPELQERLEDVWMMKRKENRKLTKSDMVREAVEEYLSKIVR